MTDTGKPPVFASARQAWNDGMSALTQMPTLIFVAFAAAIAQSSLERLVALLIGPPESSSASLLIGALIGLAGIFVVTPLYLAVHRHILLGETARRYQLTTGTPRFQRFFTAAAALFILGAAPGLLPHLLGQSGLAVALVLVLLIVAIIVGVRATLLFPAIAVDAPGANFTNAFADSAGFFWRIFAIEIVASLPLIIFAVLLFAVLGADSAFARHATAVVSVLGLAVLIAVASRLYQRLGNRLNQAPDAAVTA